MCLCSDIIQHYCRICESSGNLLYESCLTYIDSIIAFPGLSLMCPPLELNVHEEGEQTSGGLCSVPGQDHRAVPPWITPGVCEQQHGAEQASS
jgi:hypothetical protein